ncbi:hypothetical protein QUB56_05885 [Microcoleus sp. AR_TQ3_B6]|uniref:hypothetical protein n=1 Tax=Microcoleus sp. AR_TQ3_B6 TaxID=3055284 RepID=UPI002FD0D5FE
MFPVSKRAHSQGETLDELQANLREVMERLLEDETPALNRPSIQYDRSLNFYPYCSAKSAIFVNVDRTLASCNLNRMRGRTAQNLDY